MVKKRLFYFDEESRNWKPYTEENLTLDLDAIANQYDVGTFEITYRVAMMSDKEYDEYLSSLEATE